MNNNQQPGGQLHLTRVGVTVAVIIVVLAALWGVWFFATKAMAQPSRIDYLHLDNQRAIATTSLEAYDPIVEDFTAHYNAAYTEDVSADEKESIKKHYDTKFNDELAITDDRLDSMQESIALKNAAVQAKYGQFNRDYRHMLEYITQTRSTATQVVEVISGMCSKVTKISASGDYAKRFVDESQACMDKLAEAKKHVTPSAQAMMTRLQSMYKSHHEAFKKSVDEKNNTLRIAYASAGLLGLLSINRELSSIQKDYSTAEATASQKLEQALSSSSNELHATLTKASSEKE